MTEDQERQVIEGAIKSANVMQQMVVLVAELHRLAGKLEGIGHADKRIEEELPKYKRWIDDLYHR